LEKSVITSFIIHETLAPRRLHGDFFGTGSGNPAWVEPGCFGQAIRLPQLGVRW
jgi:hypothetical protein